MKHVHPTNIKLRVNRNLGARAADWVAARVGSWPFVIGQLIFFAVWITVNTLVVFHAIQFDPYPFFFFNLGMSAEAAFSTPIIMMSQNRQSEHDRHSAEVDYRTNAEALDLLRLMVEHAGVPVDEVEMVRARWSISDNGVS